MERKRQILIVEDNEINRELLGEILGTDYNLLFAADGRTGLQQMRANAACIDLVLLDIIMPVMDGYEVLEEIQKDRILREIPVVVTTGKANVEDEVKCLQLGACDFVTKPYQPMVVKLRVERTISLRESVASNKQKLVNMHNMRHEVRTPLNAIVGFSEMLGMRGVTLSDEEKLECLGFIRNNSQMLMRMIDDLLMLSDVDSDRVQLDMRDVHINEVCRNALHSTEFSHPEGVKVYFTSEVDDDYVVHTDGSRVQQAVANYLSNACKHTERGEIHVHCSTTENPGFITLSVADTGCGIPADKAEAVFERFVKLNAERQGSGLGLSIISSIATYLKGRAYLDTSYTQGARFVITIKNVGGNANC